MLRCEKCKHMDVSGKKYPCSECDSIANDLFEPKKKTNADRIRSMNIEDLAEFLKNVKADYQWVNPDYPSEDDSGAWVEWLQSEVEV